MSQIIESELIEGFLYFKLKNGDVYRVWGDWDFPKVECIYRGCNPPGFISLHQDASVSRAPTERG